MQWPSDRDVPEYFQRGMTFEGLLEAFRKHLRTRSQPLPSRTDGDDMEDDEDGSRKTRTGRKLNINKTKQLSGIQKLAVASKAKITLTKKKELPKGTPVAVRNIPFTSTEGELRSHFSHIGKITSVKIDRDNGQSRGSGIVVFGSRKEALAAVDSMQGTRLGERPIRISLAD